MTVKCFIYEYRNEKFILFFYKPAESYSRPGVLTSVSQFGKLAESKFCKHKNAYKIP